MVPLTLLVGPAFDNSLVAVSKRLSVNPDLVSAARMHGPMMRLLMKPAASAPQTFRCWQFASIYEHTARVGVVEDYMQTLQAVLGEFIGFARSGNRSHL